MKCKSAIRSALVISMTVLLQSVLAPRANAMDVFNQREIFEAMSVVKAEKKRVIRSLSEGEMAPLLQKTLDALINSGNKMLREKHFDATAEQFENEWIRFYSYSFDGFSPLDLGDHKPIFEWLAEYYDTLQTKLGKDVCAATHLDDIKAINFGAPVVIFPNGDPRTGEKYDLVEYRKHFVPFTTALLYWSMRVTCSTTLSEIPSFICSSAAAVPRGGYEVFIAPYLSDYVFKKTTVQSRPSDLDL